MGKGLSRSLGRAAVTLAPVIKQMVPVTNLAINVSAASTAAGFGTVVIGDLPEGNILFLGAVAYMQFTSADTDLTATFDGDYAIGTTALGSTTMTGTTADLVASTALGAATARVSPIARGVNATQAIFDNTDGSLEINLNMLIDAATITDDATANLTVTGVVHLSYIVLGDD